MMGCVKNIGVQSFIIIYHNRSVFFSSTEIKDVLVNKIAERQAPTQGKMPEAFKHFMRADWVGLDPIR